MKRVCIFSHCYPPARGGVEFLTKEIYKILSQKHQVHVFTGKGLSLDSYKTFENLNLKSRGDIRRLKLKKSTQKFFNKLVGDILKTYGLLAPFYFGPILDYKKQDLEIIKKSDLIIGMGMPTKSFYDAYRFAKKYKKPLILHPSYHNVAYYNNCLFFKNALNYADKIIYQTQKEKKDLTTKYSFKKHKLKKLTYVPYSKKQILLRKKQLKRIIESKTKKIFDDKKITFGYVGQISKRKNLDIIAKFVDKYFKKLEKTGWEVKFLLAGAKTNTSKEIESKLKKTSNKIKIVYNFKDKSKIFEKIDIFVNPSYEESLGLVNFEAIYFGLPVLIHKEAPFNEFFNSNINDCCFESGKELDKKIGDILKKGKNSYSKRIITQLITLEKNSKNKYSNSLLRLIRET